jgi:hypothetical protein
LWVAEEINAMIRPDPRLFIPKLDRHLPAAHARRYRRAVDDFRAAFDAIWLAEGDTVRPDRL